MISGLAKGPKTLEDELASAPRIEDYFDEAELFRSELDKEVVKLDDDGDDADAEAAVSSGNSSSDEKEEISATAEPEADAEADSGVETEAVTETEAETVVDSDGLKANTAGADEEVADEAED